MRILAVLLSLILSLPGGALRFGARVDSSRLLSDGALAGLNTLLAGTQLILSPAGYDLLWEDQPLLWTRDGVIASGDVCAPLDMQTVHGTALEKAQALGALLAEWETEKQDSVDLQEAGTARTYLRYVLGEDGWSRMWPRAAALLGLSEWAGAAITGKATLRRYFNRDGQEIGAYFYAEKLRLNDVTREVRLEYGYQPEKGLYLSFRCPAAKEQDNVRISLHMKRSGEGWTVNGELRDTNGAYTAKGKTDGRFTLTASLKQNGKTLSSGLTLQMAEGSAAFDCQNNKTTVLTGTVYWARADLPERNPPAASGTVDDVADAMARPLLLALRQAAPDSWQQILHALSPTAWIDAQKEDESI